RVALRTEQHPRPRRPATAPRSLRVCSHADLADPDRILLLVDLDAVPEHQAVRDRVAVRDPAVAIGTGRAALGAEELLVHVRAVVLPPVRARDDGETGPDPAGALREAVTLPRVRDRSLRRHHQPLADVRRRHRARVRETRDPDDAVLAKLHAHAPERP